MHFHLVTFLRLEKHLSFVSLGTGLGLSGLRAPVHCPNLGSPWHYPTDDASRVRVGIRLELGLEESAVIHGRGVLVSAGDLLLSVAALVEQQ